MRLPRRPRSLRTRIVLVIVAALVAALVVQGALGALVDARARGQIERALAEQAGAVALAIERSGFRQAAAAARQADRFLGDTRMVVRVSGELVYWTAPVEAIEARATARRGAIEVTLDRPDPSPPLGDRLAMALVAAGAVGVAGLIWLLSGGLARRMRRSMRGLTEAADAVSAGSLGARAPEGDDELGRLGGAFNRMAARLEEADARQRAFLADVAHELTTPLTAIDGFAGALADGTARTPADRAESAHFIRDEAARLRALVSDLQRLTWLDLDPPVARGPVDLAAAAAQAVGRLGADARGRGVALESRVAPGLTAVADAEHLATVLANLIANALAATPRGGRVWLTAARDGDAGVELAVTDTGRGIAAEHIPYLFERLYRVQAARDRGGAGGSGLGLPIVRRLALLMGGRVSVTSSPGRGTRFSLWLPAAPSTPAAVASAAGGRA